MDGDEHEEKAHEAHPEKCDDPADQGEKAPPFGGWCQAPDEDRYAGMWAAFREGCRGTRALARKCGVGFAMAKTAIEKGWPDERWPALRDRLVLWERQADQARERALQADRTAAETAGKTSATVWREHQKKWQPVLEMAPELIGELGRKLRSAIGSATFVKYRRIKAFDKDGKVVTIDQAYVDARDVTRAGALWATAIRDAPAAMKFLLGPAALTPEPEAPDLTAEQLEQLNRGEMPPGITEQQLGMMLLRGQFQEGNDNR